MCKKAPHPKRNTASCFKFHTSWKASIERVTGMMTGWENRFNEQRPQELILIAWGKEEVSGDFNT
jgi:hypothetical protein